MKTPVDLIVQHGTLITINPKDEVLKDGAIAIQDGTIQAIGPAREIAEQYEAQETLDATDRLVLPGLIDTHFHTGQQFERAMLYYLSKEMKLKEPIWLRYLIPFEANLSEEDVYLSGLFAYANLLKVGTTCFADPGGPRPESMAPAMEKTGIRGVLARSTLDLKEGVPVEMQDTPPGVVAKAESLYHDWNGKADGRIRVWLGMRQIMICSQELLEAVHDTAARLHTGIHIHLGEGTYEVDFAVEKSGLRPAEYLASLGFLGPNVHAAHSVLLSNKELDLYQQYDISVAHCPLVAFSYIGATRVPEMMQRGIRVGLGTDGALSSGGSLDLFQQMHISHAGLVLTHGLPFHNLSPVQPGDLLRMATMGGARALAWDQEIGSLEVGKRADMVLLSTDDLDVLPAYDPIYTAASNAGAAQVDTVLVDGKVVVKNHTLVNLDEAELRAKVKEQAPRIIARFLDRVQ